jgi:hypothetical protein
VLDAPPRKEDTGGVAAKLLLPLLLLLLLLPPPPGAKILEGSKGDVAGPSLAAAPVHCRPAMGASLLLWALPPPLATIAL